MRDRNGRVIGVARVNQDDEVIMMTSRGKIQRMAAGEISIIGRNTQGVRIMTLDDGDALAAIVRVPKEENGDTAENGGVSGPPPSSAPPRDTPDDDS